jgi:nucleoside-diphosphate-sugar epimerase
MQLCVFGSSGPVGRAVVAQALDAGHGVTAVTRHPESFGLEAPRLHVVRGDVTDPSEVEAALDGADTVISTIGVSPSRRPVSTYSTGTRNMLEAMQARGLRRIVSVSSKNLAEEGARGEPVMFRLVLAPLLHATARTLYEDMARMETLLRDSDRDWTIVRPGGLFAADRVSAYRCVAGHQPGVFTSTVDLADALIAEAVSSRPRVGATLEVLTDAGTPSLLGLVAGQVSLHRR